VDDAFWAVHDPQECARKAGKEQEMKVPHGEGLANRRKGPMRG
jgi:hypothetical protein